MLQLMRAAEGCQNDFSLRNIWSLNRTERVSQWGLQFYLHLLLGQLGPGSDWCGSLGPRMLTDVTSGRFGCCSIGRSEELGRFRKWKHEVQNIIKNRNHHKKLQSHCPRWWAKLQHEQPFVSRKRSSCQHEGRRSMSSALLWNYILLSEQQD